MAAPPSGPGGSGETAGSRTTQREAPVSQADLEKRWLELWAFATSPYGLAIDPDLIWFLTHREYSALKYQWALSKAQALNLQAVTDGVPFLPEDFMGSADREERLATAKAQRELDEIELTIENMRLTEQRMGVTPIDESGVPAWAKGKRNNG